jgi:hypothetical protein
MSRARHGKKAGGGAVPMKVSGNPDVFKEARKSGGKVLGRMVGDKAKKRCDKPARKSGGRIPTPSAPFSSARSARS